MHEGEHNASSVSPVEWLIVGAGMVSMIVYFVASFAPQGQLVLIIAAAAKVLSRLGLVN